MTIRLAGVFSMDSSSLDPRQADSGLKTLAVVKRDTILGFHFVVKQNRVNHWRTGI